MKNITSKLILAVFLFSSTLGTAVARECTACLNSTPKKSVVRGKAAVCKRAQSTAELNINNVRALINGYGNMWYDGSVAQYHVPANSTSTAMFCAALWIGGTDVNDQLRIAALRFGSEGDDYWPGPLTIDNKADVTLEVCNYYDRHYKISQAEVQAFMSMFDYTENGASPNSSYDEANISDVIKNWPAHGNFANQSYYLAPFFDADGDGTYTWQNGDYPYYDFANDLCPRTLKAALRPGEKYVPKPTMEDSAGIVHGGLLSDQVLKGDQTIWWVFNDMGNTHTESMGQPIGLEIRAQAFAFSSNDEINDMTFYSYEIINRSTYELRNTFFSQWVDPDLGAASDDFVGCDVRRGLGYCYNGNDVDASGTGRYSGIPPAIGIDFFQGPYMDPDGLDNPKIDIDKMRLHFPEELKQYELVPGNPSAGYDTIRLTDDADLYYKPADNKIAWYFTPGDVVGNCAINGVNFGNNIVDDERFGMRRFVYYNNSLENNGEPRRATDYYNYLQGIWKNGARMKYGGNAYNEYDPANVECDFMFPGDSDPLHWGTDGVYEAFEHPDDWTEKTAGNSPADRRFMQSAGPFTLKPGALNYITVGIPFAQAPSGNAWSSVELLRTIDDVCQSLFENCFKVLDGPDAPTMVAQELSNEVILYLTYEQPSSNNYNEKYCELSPSIVRNYSVDTLLRDIYGRDSVASITKSYTEEQRSYKFEGYQIYQLKDANVSVSELGKVEKARLVAQCDIENYYDEDAENPTLAIGTLVNYNSNPATGLITANVMVTGANKGIQHVFRVTDDLFATGTNTKLVNNKEYYYIAIAYAHNCYKEYSQTDPSKLDGQKQPYLAGRKNERGGTITAITVIPHNPASENGGTVVQADYGMSPNVTRIEGYGNGGSSLILTKESIDSLMGAPGQPAQKPGTFREDISSSGVYRNGWMVDPCVIAHPRYEQNAGPINVRVIDPLNIKPGQFYIKFDTIGNEARWTISKVDSTPLWYNIVDHDSIPVMGDTADFVIGRYNEQLFLDLGIAVSLSNPKPVASEIVPSLTSTSLSSLGGYVNSDALVGSSMKFADDNLQWLSSVPDNDNSFIYNWIRSGNQFVDGNLNTFLDNNSEFIPGYSELYFDDDYFKASFDLVHQTNSTFALDKFQVFEKAIFGSWAPYGLCSTLPFHPGFNFSYYVADNSVFDSLNNLQGNIGGMANSRNQAIRKMFNHTTNKSIIFNNMAKLPSVRIVLTSDQTKWTRCPVLEMCDDLTQSEGNARRFQIRRHLSVDKQGRTVLTAGVAPDPEDPENPAYIGEEGMGWFPGYAINLETGERLNIMFGEDSRYAQYNGRDMLWNPTDDVIDGTQNYVMGGRHYVYVMNAMTQNFPYYHRTGVANIAQYKTPSYDAGRWCATMLRSLDRLPYVEDWATRTRPNAVRGLVNGESVPTILPVRDSAAFLFSTVAWVNMPLVNSRHAFDNPTDIPCDVTITLNVNSPYGRYLGCNGTLPEHIKDGDSTLRAVNNNNPMYKFELTKGIATRTGEATDTNARQTYRDSILALINVVPNPYYSSSDYETSSQLETKVRFVNVPFGSTISIYTLDGTLVRRYGPTPDNQTTYDWDLHNYNGIPIGGGVYLIHFSCPGIGERVVKWFGTMRPVDLNSFKF